MKATWEQIVDFARGIASSEAKSLVEGDPESLARAKALSQVSSALKDQAPESFIDRAKSLLPNLPAAGRIWVGRLVFQSSGLQLGFRSADALAQDLTYEFEGASCSIRIEAIPQSEKVSIAGIVSIEQPDHIKVHAGAKNEAFCDEFGQFVIEAPASISQLSLIHINTGDQYLLNLR